jgi:oligopeptidase B
MGAVVNMRPDLFKAVVAQVPFVDVMNTMMDASLPLTTSEWIEWGNPGKIEEFQYMMKYSPYDNVKAQKYPAMLVQISLNDSQVPYWEGAKFAAKIRALKTDTNPLLVKANTGAGHGGASGRYDALRETAFTYAFILWQMGLTGTASTSQDALSVRITSTWAARRAGTMQARAATAHNVIVVRSITHGSDGLTP